MEPEISSELLVELLRAAAESAVEICGILRGQDGRVLIAELTRNVADDPARHFEIDPAALFTALRDARRGGLAVLGWYHSHPSGSADPSATDAAQAAADGALWLILGGGTARLWRAVADGARHGRFDPVAFTVKAPGHVEKNCEAVHMDGAGRTMTFAKAQGSSH
ncbi:MULTISPECIES: Mov34/MPN/PAD-1 family protein [unclassified Sphingomonas]|uniref:Mov34/MPN/PAD-1 family protein n=1 Tax=unclassified Sphingomonas TaxID=196159 RepID=UPI0009E79DCF|nr:MULTISPECIES: M67 family metallopeptidase [unclassified Sphingomonas]